jgi:hypothetical protein
MSSDKEYMAADLRGPYTVNTPTGPHGFRPPLTAICVCSLGASGVAQQFDLQATGMFGGDHYRGRFVRMISETAGDLWYAWAGVTGAIVDHTVAGGGTGACAYLPALTPTDELPSGQFLVIQARGQGVVRIWLTSGNPQ